VPYLVSELCCYFKSSATKHSRSKRVHEILHGFDAKVQVFTLDLYPLSHHIKDIMEKYEAAH